MTYGNGNGVPRTEGAVQAVVTGLAKAREVSRITTQILSWCPQTFQSRVRGDFESSLISETGRYAPPIWSCRTKLLSVNLLTTLLRT